MLSKDEKSAIDACLMEAGWPAVRWGRATVWQGDPRTDPDNAIAVRSGDVIQPPRDLDPDEEPEWWAAYKKAAGLVLGTETTPGLFLGTETAR